MVFDGSAIHVVECNEMGSEDFRVSGYVTRVFDLLLLRSFILSALAFNHRAVQFHSINLIIPFVFDTCFN